MRDEQEKTEPRSPALREDAPDGTAHENGQKQPGKGKGIRPKDADPDYGPPDPDDPQRSGT